MRSSNSTVPWSLTLGCALCGNVLAAAKFKFHLGELLCSVCEGSMYGYVDTAIIMWVALRSQEARGENGAGSAAVDQTTALWELKYTVAIHKGKLWGSSVGGASRTKRTGAVIETKAADDSLPSPAWCPWCLWLVPSMGWNFGDGLCGWPADQSAVFSLQTQPIKLGSCLLVSYVMFLNKVHEETIIWVIHLFTSLVNLRVTDFYVVNRRVAAAQLSLESF